MERNRNIILTFILIVVLGYSIFKTNDSRNLKNQLKNQNTFTIGEITQHKVTGIAETYYIYYTYEVNGIKYNNFENSSDKYVDCSTTESCLGKKHKVYYNLNNPKEAFMDFHSFVKH